MATLIYATNVSLDGYIEDAHGAFDWAPPDDDVFAAYTALLRSVGTFLYGRRLYATMAVCDTNAALLEQTDLTATPHPPPRTPLRPRRRPRTEGQNPQQPHHRRGEPRRSGL